MKKSVRRIRDIFSGIGILSREPIATNFLTFCMKNCLAGLKPVLDNYYKEEEEVLKETAEVDPSTGQAKRDEQGTPLWLNPESELKAVKALEDILNEEIELPGMVKPLQWAMLDKAKCAYTNKDGVRVTEPLAVSVQVQLLLDEFIQGTPAEPAEA